MSLRPVCLKFILFCATATFASAAQIVPTPEYNEPARASVQEPRDGRVDIALGPARANDGEALRLAADFLRRDRQAAALSMRVEIASANAAQSASVPDTREVDKNQNTPPSLRSNYSTPAGTEAGFPLAIP